MIYDETATICVCDLDNGALATLIISQVGFGGTLGFLLGYGLKKIAAAVFKVIALVSVVFMLALSWLASIGVIAFNLNAFTSTMGNSFAGPLAALISFTTLMVQILPMGGSFGLGFYLGAKKG